jgi:hypothetical protein
VRRTVAVAAAAFVLVTHPAWGALLSGAESPARGPVYVMDCLHRPQIRPTEVIFACADVGAYMEHIRWRRWGGRIAVGSGVYSENDCTPSCVAGRFHSHHATIWLGNVGRCHGHSVRRYYRRAKVSGAGTFPYLCAH